MSWKGHDQGMYHGIMSGGLGPLPRHVHDSVPAEKSLLGGGGVRVGGAQWVPRNNTDDDNNDDNDDDM